jgi:type II secretory pathway pseudopilin PulG
MTSNLRPSYPFRKHALPGITLFEILIVLALIGLLMGGVALGVQSISTIALRSSSSKIAALISFMSHEAIVKGRPMRLVIDLGSNTYRAEAMAATEDRAALYLQGVKKVGQGADPDAPQEETKKASFGFGDLLKPPLPSRPKPAWEPMVAKGMKLEPIDTSVKFAASILHNKLNPSQKARAIYTFGPPARPNTLCFISL